MTTGIHIHHLEIVWGEDDYGRPDPMYRRCTCGEIRRLDGKPPVHKRIEERGDRGARVIVERSFPVDVRGARRRQQCAKRQVLKKVVRQACRDARGWTPPTSRPKAAAR